MTTKNIINNQSGFTLLELLVSIFIISVLGSLSLTAYDEYRQQASYALSEQTLVNARAALEAGKINEEQFGSAIINVYTTSVGVVTASNADTLIPGVVLPQRSRLYVRHNPSCPATGWCLEDYIMVRNCSASEYTYWIKYSNGYEATLRNVTATWSC